VAKLKYFGKDGSRSIFDLKRKLGVNLIPEPFVFSSAV
jgi:hypothetical protein